MNMPKFTAEAALYTTNWYYRNNRQIRSSTQVNGMIHPMLDRPEVPPVIDVPGEEIPVHSCPPGESDWGGKCYPILTEPPLGGGDTGIPGRGDEGGESGGSGSDDSGEPMPEKSDRPTRVERMGKAWGKECEKKPTFKEFFDCCTKKSNDCIEENKKKHGSPVREFECADASKVCEKSPGRPST